MSFMLNISWREEFLMMKCVCAGVAVAGEPFSRVWVHLRGDVECWMRLWVVEWGCCLRVVLQVNRLGRLRFTFARRGNAECLCMQYRGAVVAMRCCR